MAFDAVNVRTNPVDICLREIVKGMPLGKDIAKEGVVLFDSGFLSGLVRIAEEEMSFLFTRQANFNGRSVRELRAIIGENDGKN